MSDTCVPSLIVIGSAINQLQTKVSLNHSNPYIHSTTVLCDTGVYMRLVYTPCVCVTLKIVQ